MISNLNFLDTIHVAAPCPALWEEMEGDQQRRLCQYCRKNVYNLSNMTRKQATALIRGKEGHDLCVRFYRRADGTVLTDNCPVGLRTVRNTLVRRWVAIVSLATVLFQMPRLVLASSPPTSSANNGKPSRTHNETSVNKPPISDKAGKESRKPQVAPSKQMSLEAKNVSKQKATSATEKGTAHVRCFQGSIGSIF